MIEIVRAGPLTTVQDLGRAGWAHLGVPRSGALDRPALCLANRLVGNPDDAAGLESTVGGCAIRLTRAGTVAVTGGPAPVRVSDRPAPFGVALAVPTGAVVDIGPPAYGLRSYVAIDGGVAVEPVLGSRATDVLSGLGPPPLHDGDTLPLGPSAGPPSTADFVPHQTPLGVLSLRVWLGPRSDWFTVDAITTLLTARYAVSPASNRVGARLTGPGLARARDDELSSEGIVLGAVQVPVDGQPLIFLADHPTTGGYPVIAVVDDADLAALAQARPGTTVRFYGPQC